MQTYEQFIATTPAEDVRVLNLLAMGQVLQFNVAEEADAMRERVRRLRESGLVVRSKHSEETRDDQNWQSFEAIVDPVGATYVARAASERVVLSTDPLPAP